MQCSHTHVRDSSLRQFGYDQIKHKRGEKSSFPISHLEAGESFRFKRHLVADKNLQKTTNQKDVILETSRLLIPWQFQK